METVSSMSPPDTELDERIDAAVEEACADLIWNPDRRQYESDKE
jgi:hypothetical protein